MTERQSWAELKSRRIGRATRKQGYEEASAAFELGARIRAGREAAGFTQAELAARMQTKQPAIARLEAGGVTPTLDLLRRAADALGLELVVELRQRASA